MILEEEHDAGTAECLHLDLQVGGREKEVHTLGHTGNSLSLLKLRGLTPMTTPLPISPKFLVLPKQFRQLKNKRSSLSLLVGGGILIQSTIIYS